MNHSHKYPNGEVKAHLHAYVYHEGVGQKGANNVASLIMKTLVEIGIVREDEIGGELSIIFHNCTGQNKNNTVLKLLAYLAKAKYFKKTPSSSLWSDTPRTRMITSSTV